MPTLADERARLSNEEFAAKYPVGTEVWVRGYPNANHARWFTPTKCVIALNCVGSTTNIYVVTSEYRDEISEVRCEWQVVPMDEIEVDPILVGGWCVLDKTGSNVFGDQLYNTRELAIAATSNLPSTAGFRLQRLNSIFEVSAAYEREKNRLQTEYQCLPSWFPTKKGHFAHISMRNPTHIAYTADETSLVEDRQKSIPANRYLANFFSDTLSPDKISELSQRFLGSLTKAELKITRDPAVVYSLFANQPMAAESSAYTSCMRGDHREFQLEAGRHPAQAYVTGNATLSLAYLETPEKKFVARAVVSEKNKFFVRVYGLEESHKQSLLAQLRAAGFKRANDYEGERINLESHPKYSHYVICPYIDGEIKSLNIDGVIDSEGDVCGEVTGGYTQMPYAYVCDNCQTEINSTDDEGIIVNTTEHWCSSCADDHARNCHFTSQLFSIKNTNWVAVHFAFRHTVYANSNTTPPDQTQYFYCEKTQSYYRAAIFTRIRVKTLTGYQYWCRQATYAFTNVYSNASRTYYYSKDLPTRAKITNRTPGEFLPGDIIEVNFSNCYVSLRGNYLRNLEKTLAIVIHVQANNDIIINILTEEFKDKDYIYRGNEIAIYSSSIVSLVLPVEEAYNFGTSAKFTVGDIAAVAKCPIAGEKFYDLWGTDARLSLTAINSHPNDEITYDLTGLSFYNNFLRPVTITSQSDGIKLIMPAAIQEKVTAFLANRNPTA